ncbi:phosphotransferase [Gleimia hominis]|uniref:phosphotransferase n=1 Tax=Gleimia hominis TaxID=595468 RepID=UPI000C80E29A|nr:phosphotransferase [Gleimia hominis]WIK64740.1 phosphotransferase [Gleimia hominis]
MSKPLTPLTLAAHATTLIPDLSVVSLCEPQSNDGAMAVQGIVDSNGTHWSVCSPLTQQAGVDIEAQVMLLAILAKAFKVGRVPFSVPAPQAYSRARRNRPAVMIYKQMAGTHATWEELEHSPTLASSMGRAVAALHDLPSEVIEATGMPMYSPAECRERMLALLDEAVQATVLPPNLYTRWEEALEDVSMFRFRCVPVHGDLAPECFVSSYEAVVGLESFASAQLGDPAQDLAWITTCANPEASQAFMDAYHAARKDDSDLHLASRAVLHSEMALLRWLLHGKRNDDADVVADAVQMLEDLAADVGDEPLLHGSVADDSAFSPEDLAASTAGTQSSIDAGSPKQAAAEQEPVAPPEQEAVATPEPSRTARFEANRVAAGESKTREDDALDSSAEGAYQIDPDAPTVDLREVLRRLGRD